MQPQFCGAIPARRAGEESSTTTNSKGKLSPANRRVVPPHLRWPMSTGEAAIATSPVNVLHWWEGLSGFGNDRRCRSPGDDCSSRDSRQACRS